MNRQDFITYATKLNALARTIDNICDATNLEIWESVCGDLFDVSVEMLSTCFITLDENKNEKFIECLYGAFWNQHEDMTPEDWGKFYDEWSNRYE